MNFQNSQNENPIRDSSFTCFICLSSNGPNGSPHLGRTCPSGTCHELYAHPLCFLNMVNAGVVNCTICGQSYQEPPRGDVCRLHVIPNQTTTTSHEPGESQQREASVARCCIVITMVTWGCIWLASSITFTLMMTYSKTLTSPVIVIMSVCIFSTMLVTFIHFLIMMYSGLACALWADGCT